MNLVISGIFLDKIPLYMVILIPTLVLITTSLALVLITIFLPKFRYSWLIGTIGALISVISTFLWQLKVPLTFSLPTWQPISVLPFYPSWLADGYSWSYAISLTTFGLAFMTSSVIRKQSKSLDWAGVLFIISIGLLAVTSNNPLTLVIAWTALDFSELIILLNTLESKRSEEIIVFFSLHLGSVFFLLWSCIISISSGSAMDFRSLPNNAGIYMLIAAGLRLGILPLQFSINEMNIKREVVTSLRLISAASALTLLTRIPISSIPANVQTNLLFLTGLFSIIGGWIWLVSPDEYSGLQFWILSLGSLALSAFLYGNSIGSVAWGTAMILSGGLLLLYSSRSKRNNWLLFFGFLGFSALPFSLTASVWLRQSNISGLLIIPHVLAHSLILAGYVRHAFRHQSETDLNSESPWMQVIYIVGLSTLPILIIITGLWGWFGARIFGIWWIGAATIGFSVFIFYFYRAINNLIKAFNSQFSYIKLPSFISAIYWTIYVFFQKIIKLLTTILEGDGGILWSIVLLVLFISLISQIAH